MELRDFKPQTTQLKEIFLRKSLSLGFAESCTGGLLSAALVAEAGVSSFFKGSIVSYAGEVKSAILGVSRETLQAYGEVSLPTVKAMALGGREKLNVDWCLSVSGIAGPSGGTPNKPVGLVCFGLVGPGFEKEVEMRFSSASGPLQRSGNQREDIQRQSAIFAFDFLLSAVK